MKLIATIKFISGRNVGTQEQIEVDSCGLETFEEVKAAGDCFPHAVGSTWTMPGKGRYEVIDLVEAN